MFYARTMLIDPPSHHRPPSGSLFDIHPLTPCRSILPTTPRLTASSESIMRGGYDV